MANGYRNALVQQIKDAGQELINRAESMVHPENDLITDFSILQERHSELRQREPKRQLLHSYLRGRACPQPFRLLG